MFILILEKIYFNGFVSFMVVGCVWLPQIYKNVRYGNKDTPRSILFSAIQTLQISYIPLYFMYTEDNLLFLKPNRPMFWFIVMFLGVQLITLKIQQKRPRYFLPRAIRPYIFSDYFKYDHTFSEEAAISETSKDEENSKMVLPPELRI